MERLKMQSPSLIKENIEKIGALFPQCLTEKEDENGSIVKAVDFDILRDLLSDMPIVEDDGSRYMMTWPGKRAARQLAYRSTTKTLRPCREDSVNFDTTENLYIEGDNLEVLKCLRETYLGKIKMIYIDPPYNTGKDFIYKDNYAMSSDQYKELTDEYDEMGNRLVKNTDVNGRFHTDWLNMMYSRLLLARDFLSQDGIIFISIDDAEQDNLRKICSEIFGESNFIVTLVWKRRSGANDALNNVSRDHDYVLVYGKSINAQFNGTIKSFERYENPDNDPRGPWTKDNLTCGKTASQRPNLYYPIVDPKTGIEYQCNPDHVWRFEKGKMEQLIKENKIIFPTSPTGSPYYKRHQREIRSETKPFSSWMDTQLNAVATKELREIFNQQIFDYPKTLNLITQLVLQGTNNSDIIMDFFSGSGTTAHAILKINERYHSKRKFILVQLPENKSLLSTANNSGYNSISEIGKERIRRAGKQIVDKTGNDVDIGFRVLKLDSSNVKDVYYTPSETKQHDLDGYINNIKEDRTSEDLLFQVLLEFGIPLSLPISTKTIQGLTVFNVAENSLSACFDKGVTEDVIKEMAKEKPLYAAFRDSSYSLDQTKINVEQIFKQLSPETRLYAV